MSINLETNSETKMLCFMTKYLVQINFTFEVSVFSEGFAGTAHFCVRREQLERFCNELISMYSLLDGSSVLEDNDSDAFVKFEFNSTGHLIVKGQVGGSHEDQMVRFKFQTDQTVIPQFVTDFQLLICLEDPI